MNDQDICVAAMSEWPVEARPTHIKYGATGHASRPECFIDILPTGGCRMLMDHHAQAIFRDSGLAWLMHRQKAKLKTLYLMLRSDGQYSIRLSEDSDSNGVGATPLAAIDMAVRRAYSISPASEKEKPR